MLTEKEKKSGKEIVKSKSASPIGVWTLQSGLFSWVSTNLGDLAKMNEILIYSDYYHSSCNAWDVGNFLMEIVIWI